MPTRTALNGPAHRIMPKQNAGQQNSFPIDIAPSIDLMGSGTQDHRLQFNKANNASGTGVGVLGWYGSGYIAVVDQVPSALAANNIVAAQNAVSGTPLTLAAASTGITIVGAGGQLMYPSLRTVPAGALILDGLPGILKFGTGFISGFYQHTTFIQRAVTITGVAGGAGGNFLVSGYDSYGYPLTQLLTVGAGAVSATTLKTFKFITSVVPQFSDAHNYTVGTADVFGFPIFSALFSSLQLRWNNAVVTSATGYTAGVTTSPSTNLLGDVRGTYAVQSASDGTKRFTLSMRPALGSMVTNPTTGLYGVAQV